MRNSRLLLLEQLDEKLKPIIQSGGVLPPNIGWIKTIRTSLNMTMAQLGKKLGITRQGINRIEESEAKGTVTLNTLKDVANSLDLRLVYVLIPRNGSFDDLINTRAERLAKQIVMRTNQTMKLEAQSLDEKKISKAIQDLTYDIKREMRKSLWD